MKLRLFVFIFFLIFIHGLLSAKNCISDDNCYKYYTCKFGQCVLDNFDDAPLLNIKIASGIIKEYDKVLGYDTTDNIYNVVMGSFKLEAVKKDAPFYIKVINMKLERSDNIDIRNIRLVEDQNLNGKYDDVDRVVMAETEYSYGPYTRFIEFVEGEDLLKTGDGMNYLFVADYVVDRENKEWPAYGRISFIESMFFSDNAELTNSYYNYGVFDPVAVNPWGRVLFVDTEHAHLIAHSGGIRLEGIKVFSNENTAIRKISFKAFYYEDFDDTYENSDDSVFYISAEDPENGERIYSLQNDEKEKVSPMIHELEAWVPLEISVRSEGLVCGERYDIFFDVNGIKPDGDDFFIAGLPVSFSDSMAWDEIACGEKPIGCSVVVVE